MREVIIQKVPEDTPLPVLRKTQGSIQRHRKEWRFLDRQKRQFMKLAGDVEVTTDEYMAIQKERFSRGRMGKCM
tara:strand:- start:567 stop:788 length:222 start_codon:yes stop_codon:yes gene_type:complete